MSERLDAEEAHDIMRPCFELMREAVHRYGGTVSQFLGDGIMALFGAPLAQEDHAERGVLAALSIQSALQGFEKEILRSRGVTVRMRIGLNSGPVVVSTIGTDLNPTYTAIGDTVNIASRVQGLASVGSVAISESTAGLVEGKFLTRDMGAHPVKGKALPVVIREVIRPVGRAPRRHVRSRSSFVGRQVHLAAMLERYEDVRGGQGQVILISGEPGIGKSRLVDEFGHRVDATGAAWLTGQCVSYGKDAPYLPLIDLIRRKLQVDESDSEENIVKKLEEYVESLDADLSADVPWLRFLLSVDPGDRAVRVLDASIRKVRVFEALRSFVLAHSRPDPLVLVFEDLHWLDEVSQEFISFLLGSIRDARALVVLTYRPEYQQPFGALQRFTTIALQSLVAKESSALAGGLLGGGELPADLTAIIAVRTEGNPFFIEEVVHSLIETGAVRREGSSYTLAIEPDELAVPPTVQDVVAARLDRLDGATLEVLRTAAIVGMEFGAETLRAACDSAVPLTDAIRKLKGSELISESSLYPELTYTFRHALVREVAVESLLKPRRRTLHLAVAQALEQRRSDRHLERVEALAYHYEAAESWAEAAKYLVQSGEKALHAAAPLEAQGFFRRALLAAVGSPGCITPEDTVALHGGMGQAMMLGGNPADAAASFGAMLETATEAGNLFGQGRALLELVTANVWAHRFEEALRYAEVARKAGVAFGSAAMLSGSRYATAFMATLSGDMATGRVAAAEALQAAREPQGAILLARALSVQGMVRHWDGQEKDAAGFLDEMVRLSRRPEDMASLTQALFFRALACCGEGDYLAALACLDEGLELATRFGNNPLLSRFRNTLGWVYHDLCNFGPAIEENLEAVRLAEEVGDPEIVCFGELNLADCYLAVGRLDEVATHLEPVIRESAREGSLGDQWMRWRYVQHLYVNQGELALRRGDVLGALRWADECVTAAKQSGSPRNVVKGLRLRGTALAEQGRFGEADAALTQALELAREVGNPFQVWRTLAAYSDARGAQGLDDGAAALANEALVVVEAVATSLGDAPLGDTLRMSPPVVALRSAASHGAR
jgi:class 3 adenylate cyclase/tetratricopeptide (TPR) repeat protein